MQTDPIPAPAEPKAKSEGRGPGHETPRLGRQGWLPLVGTPELGPEVNLAKRTDITMSREGHWGEIPSLVRAHDCKRQAVSQSVVLQEEKAICMAKTLLGRWWRVRRSRLKAEKSGI